MSPPQAGHPQVKVREAIAIGSIQGAFKEKMRHRPACPLPDCPKVSIGGISLPGQQRAPQYYPHIMRNFGGPGLSRGSLDLPQVVKQRPLLKELKCSIKAEWLWAPLVHRHANVSQHYGQMACPGLLHQPQPWGCYIPWGH